MEIELERRPGADCPLCQGAVGADDAQETCDGCRVTYHLDCLREMGGADGACTTPGCGRVGLARGDRPAPSIGPPSDPVAFHQLVRTEPSRSPGGRERLRYLVEELWPLALAYAVLAGLTVAALGLIGPLHVAWGVAGVGACVMFGLILFTVVSDRELRASTCPGCRLRIRRLQRGRCSHCRDWIHETCLATHTCAGEPPAGRGWIGPDPSGERVPNAFTVQTIGAVRSTIEPTVGQAGYVMLTITFLTGVALIITGAIFKKPDQLQAWLELIALAMSLFVVTAGPCWLIGIFNVLEAPICPACAEYVFDPTPRACSECEAPSHRACLIDHPTGAHCRNCDGILGARTNERGRL